MAKVALYRCCNTKCSTDRHGRAIFDFCLPTDQPPVCPQCKIDMRDRPLLIVKRKLIHYDPPHATIGEVGTGHAACDPALPWEGNEHVGFTGWPGSVTCPDCQQTDAWREAAVKSRAVAEYDLPKKRDSGCGC